MRVKLVKSGSPAYWDRWIGKANSPNDAHDLAWDYVAERFQPPLSMSVSVKSDEDGKYYQAFYC